MKIQIRFYYREKSEPYWDCRRPKTLRQYRYEKQKILNRNQDSSR